MKTLARRIAGLGALMLIAGHASAGMIDPRFSIDPASPSIDGDITPDDVLKPGPQVDTQGTALGMTDLFFEGQFDNLDALSYGRDPISRSGEVTRLYFSVDRVAVGVQGTAVYAQAQPGVESAAGDVYRALPRVNGNRLEIGEIQLGLIPGFFGDDLDGLELDTRDRSRSYFSIDALSESNGFGALDAASDIFLNGLGTTFATGQNDIGLDEMDDLDALVLWDVFNPGHLDPGIDLALFSLSAFSPNTFTSGLGTYSPADILFTDFTGTFSLWASAAQIGLRDDDNLDALDTIVPEPGTLALLALSLLGLTASRRSLRFKTE